MCSFVCQRVYVCQCERCLSVCVLRVFATVYISLTCVCLCVFFCFNVYACEIKWHCVCNFVCMCVNTHVIFLYVIVKVLVCIIVYF